MTKRMDHDYRNKVGRMNVGADRRERDRDLAVDGLIALLDHPSQTDKTRKMIYFTIRRLQEGDNSRLPLAIDVLATFGDAATKKKVQRLLKEAGRDVPAAESSEPPRRTRKARKPRRSSRKSKR